MKGISLISLFFIITSQVFAQNPEPKFREWSDGALTWQDFSIRKTNTTNEHSYLHYVLDYGVTEFYEDGYKIENFEAFSYINKDSSWVEESSKNTSELLYNQIIFDILEVHKQKLQIELNQLSDVKDSEPKLEEQILKVNEEIALFKKVSDFGKNEEVLMSWNKRIKTELANPLYKLYPDYEKKDFGYGLNIGAGYGILSNSINQYFSNPVNLYFGGAIGYRKSLISLNLHYGNNKVTNEINSESVWPKDLKTGWLMYELSYGYSIIDEDRYKLTPFAGVVLNKFSSRGNDIATKNSTLNITWIAGANFDLKIIRRLKFIPSGNKGGKRESSETSIRFRLYATQLDLPDNLKGYSINLMVGIDIFGRGIKLK